VDAVDPFRNERLDVAHVDVLVQPICQFGLAGHADMPEDGSGGSREEGLDIVQPGAVNRRKDEFESSWPGRQVGHSFPGFMGGVIVQEDADQDPLRTGGIDAFEEGDELAAPVSAGYRMMDDAADQVHSGGKGNSAEALVLVIALHRAAPLFATPCGEAEQDFCLATGGRSGAVVAIA